MNIVVIGAGFAGVRLALRMANKSRFNVKLICDKSYFEYHAALYRSATGRSPLEVAIPLRDFFASAKNIEVVADTIVEIDSDSNIVVGKSGAQYPYEALVIALGNVTQYFGIDGLQKYSYGIKTVQEALELKRHLHEDLLKNQAEKLNYAVIGGGATGVELAAEMTAYLKRVRKKHGLKDTGYTINLIEANSHLLPALPADFGASVRKRLQKLGVKVHLNTAIKAETADRLKIPGSEIKTDTVVWTAGATNHPLLAKYNKLFKPGRLGRVVLDEYLMASPNTYVVGDSADTKFSGMAQTALHDANFVYDHLMRVLKGKAPMPYEPKRPIYAIPVGPHWSAVLWGKTRLYGYLGWILRRLADLRLYLLFLPLAKAISTWRYGIVIEEQCEVCKQITLAKPLSKPKVV
jgi:NADH:ubiquinone reductase (H+-translocating)